jgi:hypothetical protein
MNHTSDDFARGGERQADTKSQFESRLAIIWT